MLPLIAFPRLHWRAVRFCPAAQLNPCTEQCFSCTSNCSKRHRADGARAAPTPAMGKGNRILGVGRDPKAKWCTGMGSCFLEPTVRNPRIYIYKPNRELCRARCSVLQKEWLLFSMEGTG